MIELDEKLNELIIWIVRTYSCSKKEAVASIKNKLETI